ncbi:hypothetical protein [Cyclobacterium plantarum]|uniref:Uncharacterized protein n=1 Tax=Cyclobacterium plantarum TaxID=2716263 RepID=A0ABX0H677_9BACT|nr:hypothetical protein [Cyclobacterium plantarum]NHE57313.1 hypothetical protein [Cyclobacterium plantarum]
MENKKPNEKQIEEIADLLDCGMLCFYHRSTGTIESHPDPDDPFFDPEPWEDLMEKIEADWTNYDRFEKMESREAYQVMEKFAFSLDDAVFREEILQELSKRKPFQHFKMLIDDSEYRQDWFDFKKKAYIEFVKEQIDGM